MRINETNFKLSDKIMFLEIGYSNMEELMTAMDLYNISVIFMFICIKSY